MIIEKGNQEKTKVTDANTETIRRFPNKECLSFIPSMAHSVSEFQTI